MVISKISVPRQGDINSYIGKVITKNNKSIEDDSNIIGYIADAIDFPDGYYLTLHLYDDCVGLRKEFLQGELLSMEFNTNINNKPKKDVFKFLDMLNNSKVRYSFSRNIKDSQQENIEYTVIKLPYDYISFYFSEETGKLIKIENERRVKKHGRT